MQDVQRGEILFECDGGCGAVLETGTSNVSAANNARRREGWRALKVGDEWTHLCPRCEKRL